MEIRHTSLLREIERFQDEVKLSDSYIGKAAVGNSELIPRLRSGGRIWPETEAKLRSFIAMRREMARMASRKAAS